MRRPPLLRLAIVTALVLWGVSAIAAVSLWQWLMIPEVPRPWHQEVAPSAPEPWFAIPDRLRKGDSLASLLYRNGFTTREIHDLAQSLATDLNLRRLQPGDEVQILYGSEGEVEKVRIHRGPLDTFEARREGEGWSGEQIPVQVERRENVLHGSVRGSLFASMEAMGETAELVVNFAEIFAWDFDFYTESRTRDRFSLVVEKLYRDGNFVGYGDLKAARYVSGKTDLVAYLYEDPTAKRDYYDPAGNSMRKAFLRAPLSFRRISSRFSYSRLHPVFKRRMPHLGVDYAARVGTPVLSIADGTVVAISRKGGGGNSVTVRHRMGYRSAYLHLSRFARGLRVGKRVAQKEVIGYVGATGIATGPHLDFRLTRHGEPVNPLKQIFPPGPPVPVQYLSGFQKQVQLLAERLEQDSPRRRAVGE